MRDSTNLVARILLAHMFVISGIQKSLGYAGTQHYMESAGVSGGLVRPCCSILISPIRCS